MTKINKLVLHGFKSFAKRTEMVFGDEFNCIVGPNGSGKCVVGDTHVQLADGSTIKIRDLVEDNLKKLGTKKIDDGEIALGGNTKILTLDVKTLKTVEQSIQSFVKRTSPKHLLKIRTRSGREVTATEYHPLFVMDENTLRSIRADELKEGIRVAVPRNIDIKIKTKIFYELLDQIKPEDNVYVPFNKKFKEVSRNIKGTLTWGKLSRELNIPKLALKGLQDGQAINFSYLVKILRRANYTNDQIISCIPKIKAKTSNLTYKLPWENSPELATVLGYLLAEGRLPTTSNQIWFTNGTEEIVKEYHRLIQEIFGLKATVNEYKPGCWDVLAYAEPIRVFLGKLGMKKGTTENKEITNLFLSHATKQELGALLNGLYSGDGHVFKNGIEITTKSKKLERGMQQILLRLGVLGRSKEVIKIATNSGYSGKYQKITITENENIKRFSLEVTFTHQKKQERLNQLLEKKGNPNVDLLEVNTLVKETAKELGINIKPTKKEFPKLDAYAYNQCLPSRQGVKQLVNELFVPTANQKSMASQLLLRLHTLSTSDIFWDEVVEIEKIISQEEWVYDLCVEKNHNFIANNLYVHNSNILDALCFVLGKSSAKALRTEKSANLIYNGGKSKKPASQAEVSLYFDNSKKTFPTDDKEVKISRIVKPKGNSVYKINDERRTRMQILEMLSIANINPNGYNIILQGDITRFISMQPEERRVLVEQISGISIYEEKKHKALNELKKVDEKLKEAGIILAERSTQLKELGKEKDQAIKYKDLSHKIKVNKASLLHKKLTRKNKEQKEFEEKAGKVKERLDKKTDELLQAKEKIKTNRGEIDKINKEIESQGEKESVAIHKEVEKLKVDLASSKNRMQSVDHEIKKIGERKKQLGDNKKDIEVKVKKLEEEKADLTKQTKARENEQKQIQEKVDSFKKKHNLNDAADIEKQIDQFDKGAEEFQKKITSLRQQQQEVLREKDKTEFQIQTIDEKIDKVLEVEKENKAQVTELKQKKQEFKKASAELSKHISDDSSLAAQLGNARTSLFSLNEQFAKLNARNMSIQEATGADEALKRILNQKKNIPGIYGTISELGQVPAKHALALEIAAGNKIKSVVVQDEKAASQAIKYLKENRLGIVTFLPLNKMKSPVPNPHVAEASKARGVHGRAIELVKFDARYKSAFKYIFGETLIVDNIDVARRIGVGKAKMVTLDGDVTERSGAMQGGYRKRKSGGLGFKQQELSKELEQVQQKMSDTEMLSSRLQKEKKKNEEQIAKLREFKAHLEADIIKLEKILHLDTADLDASRKVKKELQETLKRFEKQTDKVLEDISEVNKGLAQNRMQRQQLRQKINDLRNPRLVAELNAFEEKRKQLHEQLVQKQGDIKNIDAQITNILQPEIMNIEKIIKQHDKEEDDFKSEKKNTEELMKTMGGDLKQKEKQQEQFQKQFKGLFGQRTKLDEVVKKVEKQSEELSEQQKKIEIQINTYSLELAKVKVEVSGIEHEYKEFEGIGLVHNKSEEQMRKEIGIHEGVITRMGNVNMKALERYDGIAKEYNSLMQKKEKLVAEKEDVLVIMNDIETKKKELFMKTFDVVNKNFQNFFGILSTKGEASLALESPDNPFEGGLLVKVRLSGKRFMDIRSLSGGEKTMTALAFIFAIQEHEPASFYILDEVDAALDKKNSQRLAQLVKRYTDRAQYVVISHNDAIITEANQIYGVAMDEHGKSIVTSLKV